MASVLLHRISAMCTIRLYQPSDFKQFQDLYLLSLGGRPGLRERQLRALDVRFSKPGYSPEKDLLLAHRGERLAGFLECIPEDMISRVILNGFVHEDFRREGIAGALLDRAVQLFALSGRNAFHVLLDEREMTGAAFLMKKRFRRARIYLDMDLNLKEFGGQNSSSHEFELKTLRKGGESLLSEVQNRVFENTWGFCPNTKDDIRFYLDWTGSRIEHVLVHMKNDEVAGYLWPHPVEGISARRVRLHMLGIHPRHRGRGLGRSLLFSALTRLREEGWEEVELTVDSENTAARRLYLSLGFRLRNRMIWFEKRIGMNSD
jgi:ribosomal protein S18 acetylase RimI-like enzyme